MTSEQLLDEAISECLKSYEYSQCGISKQKIGSSLIAQNKDGNHAIFSAPNIELSTSVVIHAEQLSLLKAISEGFVYPKVVFVTSVSENYHVPMCLLCRGWYYYLNPDLEINVVGLDGKVKLVSTLSETIKYPYFGKSRIQ